jgi:hypothetical protein
MRCIIDETPFFEDGAWYHLRTALTVSVSSARTSPPLPKYSVRFSRPLFLSGILYVYPRRQQDVLSVFDENDPTAARPTTREKARELCSEHMTEWASSNSNSGDLTKLRIGIPQVCTQCQSPIISKITGHIGVLSDFSR